MDEHFGIALNEIWTNVDTLSWSEIEAAFASIEERFAGTLAADPAMRLEMCRRVAEGMLLAAQIKEQPVAACEALLTRLTALGWTDLFTKAQVLNPFCTYCLDQGEPALPRKLLGPLKRELEQAFRESGDAKWSAQAESVGRILDRLEKNQGD